MTDGDVIIGTKLDTRQLEKDVKDAEKKLEKLQNQEKKLTSMKQDVEVKIELDKEDYERQLQKINEEHQKNMQLVSVGFKDQGSVEYEYKNQITKLEEKYSSLLERNKNQLSGINTSLKLNTSQQEKLKNKVAETTKEIEKQETKKGITKLLKDAGNETENLIKKITRWGLAIFGIRSAYMFVRQAMSTLSQYNEQMATNIEWIRYLLASSLKPIIEYLINLAYQLLTYLNYIAQAWFGINLFANATTEEFNKQKKAMGGTASAAKELQKTLAGFDEMNILQENGGVGRGGGGGGMDIPEIKVPKFKEVKLPKWMDWIAKHKDEVIAGLAGIAGGIAALGIAQKLVDWGIIDKAPIGKIAGIALIISGIVYTIEGIIGYLNDPSFENFGKTVEGIGTAIIGVGLVASNVVVALVGGVILIWGVVIKYWSEIKTFIEGIFKWFEERLDDIDDVFGKVTGNAFRLIIEYGRKSTEYFGNFVTSLKQIFNGIIEFFRNVFKGNWQAVWNSLKEIAIGVFNAIVSKAGNIFNSLDFLVATFINNSIGTIKMMFNGVIGSIENMVNFVVEIINGLVDLAKGLHIPGVSKVKRVKIPRLAKGGIINQPGRGVPVGSAISGERGQEGVIPLTDSQQMALLGEAIGKYITVNANITNTMNGRVISRELQKVQNENDFAFNR